MTESTPTPDPVPAAQPTKRARAAQDRIIAAYIADAKKLLSVASTDAEIRPILEAHGYDDSEFATGNALAAAADAAFEGRAGGMGDQKLAGEALRTAIRTAREDFAAFRSIARATFPGEADRISLSLKGEVPDDISRFITQAKASYTAAAKDPYAVKIAKRGYPAARLTTLSQNLDSLTATGGAQDEAEGDAIGDTAARDAAYAALKAFIKELKGTARGALRGKPALLAKLEL